MSAIIDVEDVAIKTPVVTIKALTVSGKQMTLAVFRQLPVSEWCETQESWGFVRYKIKDEGDYWLVFSREGTLWRRIVAEVPATYYVKKSKQILKNIIEFETELKKQNSTKYFLLFRGHRGIEVSRENVKEQINEVRKLVLEEEQLFSIATQRYEFDTNLKNTLPQLYIAT